MSQMTQSLIATANRIVPFSTAVRWAGLEFRGEARDRGNKVSCPFCEDGGSRDPAFRVYPDHGWCFADCWPRYYSPVSLLAKVWGVRWEEAADRALKEVGWKPPTAENIWADAIREPEPDRAALGEALRHFCGGFPGWKQLQYDPGLASLLSGCLGYLSLVHTEGECRQWLARCKVIMQRAIEGRGIGQDQAH